MSINALTWVLGDDYPSTHDKHGSDLDDESLQRAGCRSRGNGPAFAEILGST